MPAPLTVAAFDGTEKAAQARPPASTMRRAMSRFTRRAPYKVSPPGLTSARGSNSSIRPRTVSGAESPLVMGTSSWARSSRYVAPGTRRRRRTWALAGSATGETRTVGGRPPAARTELIATSRDAARERSGPESGQGQQALSGGREWPVTIRPLGSDVVHIGQGGGRGQAAVRLQPGVLGRHVVLGEVRVSGDVE